MKKFAGFFFLFLLCATPYSCSSDHTDTPPSPEPEDGLLFRDDFDTFNTAVWTKETHQPGWVNQELQAYDAAHVSVGKDNGRSVLMLTAERRGRRIYSGRVNSKGKMSFKHGRVEASIRLPRTANGLWPAFWMMGDTDKPWPQCGEIDIMEMGESGGIKTGTTETYFNTAIHFGPSQDKHQQEYKQTNVKQSLQDGNYHLYALDWDENSLIISVDGIQVHTFDIGPTSGRHEFFQDRFYLLFNLAVGGLFTGIDHIDGITALKDGQKAVMYVDWVKVYNRKQ